MLHVVHHTIHKTELQPACSERGQVVAQIEDRTAMSCLRERLSGSRICLP